MASEPNQPEKRIIVDEDWKSQVEAEKEAARRAQTAPGREAPAEEVGGGGAEAPAGPSGPLPPASLNFLIGTLYLQGAMALGLLPNPVTNKREIHREAAQHAIDLLGVLETKTAGNRTPDETAELDAALHELRLVYVQLG
jgi:hypothetical protein